MQCNSSGDNTLELSLLLFFHHAMWHCASMSDNPCTVLIVASGANVGMFCSAGNHRDILAETGHEVRYYRYYNQKSKGLDYQGMIEDLKVVGSRS